MTDSLNLLLCDEILHPALHGSLKPLLFKWIWRMHVSTLSEMSSLVTGTILTFTSKKQALPQALHKWSYHQSKKYREFKMPRKPLRYVVNSNLCISLVVCLSYFSYNYSYQYIFLLFVSKPNEISIGLVLHAKNIINQNEKNNVSHKSRWLLFVYINYVFLFIFFNR